jgi:putative redox protein
MIHETKTKWLGKMAFESEFEGHRITVDANKEFGGENLGASPKSLILMSLAGCTGMDVASLLKKMRVEVEDFKINVNGELTDEHPKYYSAIQVEYLFKGKNLDKEKLEKAVNLSQERYCGVHYMLKQAATITHTINYIETVSSATL